MPTEKITHLDLIIFDPSTDCWEEGRGTIQAGCYVSSTRTSSFKKRLTSLVACLFLKRGSISHQKASSGILK